MAAYEWKTGSYQGKISAQTAGEICEGLESKGELNAQNLVDISRPEDAPLHSAFEWDDSVAAEEWRKQQARCIINSIVVVTESHPPMRAYYSVAVKDSNYYSLQTVIKQPDKYEALLKQAKRDLQIFRQKYNQLSELSNIMRMIDELSEE